MQSEIIKPEEVMSALISGSDVLCIKPEITYSVSGGKSNVSCMSLRKQTFESIESTLSNYPDNIILVKINNDKTENDEEEEPNYAE